MSSETNTELVNFFKVLADSSRLKIVGLLAGQPCTVEQLAAMLNLRPSTVSHHLTRLSVAGLVTAKAEGYYRVYQLEMKVLEEKKQRLLSREELKAAVSDLDPDAFDRKVVLVYSLPDGRLKTIPAQRKKLEAILRHVVKSFKPGIRYGEKQVNETLARFHIDTATLRRELVGFGLMRRAGGGGDYWRL